MTEIHTCSYSCQRIECIRAQRDELRGRLEALAAEGVQAGEVEQREYRPQAGEPPTWFDEWFIAETQGGERVVLRRLPKEWAYDYTTADGTYFKADRIRWWMQFPDSQFKPLEAALSQQPEARGVVGELVEVGDDESGQPRLLIHTTRDAIRAANLIPFSQVEVRNG